MTLAAAKSHSDIGPSWTPPPVAPTSIGPKRVMVYCHDLFGLGNVSRMLSFCRHLQTAYPDAYVLFVTGSGQLQTFALPPRFDYIKLPEIARATDGLIAARMLSPLTDRVVQMRGALLTHAVKSFHPDLVVVDKKPFGALDELRPTLAALRATASEARLVLLLRDVVDTPERTRRLFDEIGFEDALADFYDRVLVVGDPAFYDVANAYGLAAATRSKLAYCGYLEPPAAMRSRAVARAELGLAADEPTVLATVGGGEDGLPLLRRFLAALDTGLDGIASVVLCGPRLPPAAKEEVVSAARQHPRLRVLRTSADVAGLMLAADVIVSMAGYNSICEVVAAGRPAVLLPRTTPSEEQLERARVLARLGLATHLPPTSAPALLAATIRGELTQPRRVDPRGFFSPVPSARRIAAVLDPLYCQPTEAPRCRA